MIAVNTNERMSIEEFFKLLSRPQEKYIDQYRELLGKDYFPQPSENTVNISTFDIYYIDKYYYKGRTEVEILKFTTQAYFDKEAISLMESKLNFDTYNCLILKIEKHG